jgi:methenyltetrahydromethanopterin cyclohydrolase
MDSPNRMATELVDEAIEFADELAVGVTELDNEATVLDFGVDAMGGVEAGLLLAEIQTAGLATVTAELGELAGAPRTEVTLTTDHPALSLLCSAKAGWELSVDGFEGLGSGPARALVAEEAEFTELGYRDEFDFAVLAVESETLPDEAVAERVARMADVPTSGVFLAGFATASIAGSVTMAARAAELAAFRAFELGYDPRDLLSVTSRAPLAPVPADEETAIARTNDAIAYGGRVHLTVDTDDDCLRELASAATDRHGTPFAEIFETVDWRLHELDEAVFAPAQVTVDVVGGPTYTVGGVDEALVADSFRQP